MQHIATDLALEVQPKKSLSTYRREFYAGLGLLAFIAVFAAVVLAFTDEARVNEQEHGAINDYVPVR